MIVGCWCWSLPNSMSPAAGPSSVAPNWSSDDGGSGDYSGGDGGGGDHAGLDGGHSQDEDEGED
jgi:hypothetical protein